MIVINVDVDDTKKEEIEKEKNEKKEREETEDKEKKKGNSKERKNDTKEIRKEDRKGRKLDKKEHEGSNMLSTILSTTRTRLIDGKSWTNLEGNKLKIKVKL